MLGASHVKTSTPRTRLLALGFSLLLIALQLGLFLKTGSVLAQIGAAIRQAVG